MDIFEESCGVVMTQDKKCILRGRSDYNMMLTTLDEKSKLKVRKWGISKNFLDFVNKRHIKLSDKVKKLYNIEDDYYNEEKIGELIEIKAKSKIVIEEDN